MNQFPLAKLENLFTVLDVCNVLRVPNLRLGAFSKQKCQYRFKLLLWRWTFWTASSASLIDFWRFTITLEIWWIPIMTPTTSRPIKKLTIRPNDKPGIVRWAKNPAPAPPIAPIVPMNVHSHGPEYFDSDSLLLKSLLTIHHSFFQSLTRKTMLRSLHHPLWATILCDRVWPRTFHAANPSTQCPDLCRSNLLARFPNCSPFRDTPIFSNGTFQKLLADVDTRLSWRTENIYNKS